MRACDAAIEVLIETDNPSVMYGDEWLTSRGSEHGKTF